ncbi:MAG: hypothetical protein U1F70_12745 [Candidatus Competibacteraceae bacterium]
MTYTYAFRNGATRTFNVFLDRKTLGLIMKPPTQPPSWTFLRQNQCANCSLDARDHPFCPVALNFAEIAEHFAHAVSYEEVHVVVTTEERIYSRDTTLQQGLTSLLGIIMPTSGCPVLEPLKPMVRFHLPFATITETVFRMVSMCLVAQYLRHGEGKPFDFGLGELAKIYAEVAIVNRDFVRRLRDASMEDANINALVGLDCFATMVPLIAEDTLNEIKLYFSAFLRQ